MLPIGLLPILPLGRCFSKGNLTVTALHGDIAEFTIDNMGNGEEVTSDQIPPGLFAFTRAKRGIQRLFRIPTIEMVRYLFFHNKTMANALMRPGGILELFRPEQPGIYKEFHIHSPAKCRSRH
jgi:hypothetical protein